MVAAAFGVCGATLEARSVAPDLIEKAGYTEAKLDWGTAPSACEMGDIMGAKFSAKDRNQKTVDGTICISMRGKSRIVLTP